MRRPILNFALVATLALSGCATFALQSAANTLASKKPGTILRIWPLTGGVRPDYKGYRILYRSTGVDGEPVAVTGAVMLPLDEDGENYGERHVVAWAHPTTGVVKRCAPTRLPGLAGSIQGLDHLADKGYIIVATDYVGLGTDPHHPYLIGETAAATILDSVRAVRQLKHARASNSFAVWGHSQGGHAALFTGLYAKSYAPELNLVGVAAAAPATDLMALFEADRNTSSGRSLTSMSLLSWSRVFGLPIDEFVHDHAKHHFEALAEDCIQTLSDLQKLDRDEKALERQFLKTDPLKHPDVRELMERNTPGQLHPGTPVFISQGTADDLVLPSITKKYVRHLCDGGAHVDVHVMPGVSHMYAARDSAYRAVSWIHSRFSGHPPTNDC